MPFPVRIADAEVAFERFEMRVPFVYGKGVHTHQTRAEVRVCVEAPASSKRAWGRAQMTVAASWSWPSTRLSGGERLRAMQALMERLAGCVKEQREPGHPLDLYLAAKEALPGLAQGTAEACRLSESPPALAQMICQAPFDLATHDAYGLLCQAPAYELLGPEHGTHDLAYYLGDSFAGAWPRDFIRAEAAARVRIAHTVGLADALSEGEVSADAPQDGGPNSLEAWIRSEGLDAFKLKLKGNPEEDARRTLDVAKLVESVRAGRPYMLSVDGNEQYESPEAVVEMLEKVRAGSESAWAALAYVEQPTPRNLAAKGFDVSPITARKPLIADEAVTNAEELRLAYRLGWSGFGLKAGKSLSGCLFYTALTRKAGRLLTLQDNGNTGLAHAASMGLASRVALLGGVESNGRQFNPAGNTALRERFPKLFKVQDGRIETGELRGPGLGYA